MLLTFLIHTSKDKTPSNDDSDSGCDLRAAIVNFIGLYNVCTVM